MVNSNDEAALFGKFLETRDPELREEIIMQYLPLVYYVLGRFGISQGSTTEYEDLVSQGTLGLIKAVDRYDPVYGTRFSTYATVRIRGTVQDHLRSMDLLSRTARQRIRMVQEGINTLWGEFQRDPTEEELARYLKVEMSEVQLALEDAERRIISLDSAFESIGQEKSSLYDRLVDEGQLLPDETLDDKELRAAVVSAFQALPKRNQLILSLYYYEDLTLKEIGKVLAISESRVSQLHGRAVLILRSIFRNADRLTPCLTMLSCCVGDSEQTKTESDGRNKGAG